MISTVARYGPHYVFSVCFLSNKNGTAQKLGLNCQVLLLLFTAKWHKSKPHKTVFALLPDSSLRFTRRRIDFPPGHYIALKNFTLWKWILTGNFSPFCFYKNVREMERKIRKCRGVIYPGNLSWTQHEMWVKMQSHTGIIRAEPMPHCGKTPSQICQSRSPLSFFPMWIKNRRNHPISMEMRARPLPTAAQ